MTATFDKGKKRISAAEAFGGGASSSSSKKAHLAAESDHLPWVEKYRPSTTDDLIAHNDIISTISRFIDQNKLPHLLFYGPPGTGKTSLILACARKLYGEKYKQMLLELNASDDRGIDVVRDQIVNFASTRTVYKSGFKLIILDEADAMTQVAQGALRRIIEKYTKNVRFCIICNYVSKLIPAIQSRCTRFRFAPLKEEQISGRLAHIIRNEGVTITEDGKKALTKLSKGDMRRALNILQACHAGYSTINEDAIYSCTGSPHPKDIEKIAHTLLQDDFTSCYQTIRLMQVQNGLALTDILTELADYLQFADLPPKMRIFLMDKMADVEYRLSTGATEKCQLGSLVGTFNLSKGLTTTAGK